MILRGAAVVLLAVLLGACSNAQRQAAPEASLTPRDKKLLAGAPYKKIQPPEMYLRAIVDYAGTEKPGTIVVDTDRKYLYLVEGNGKAIRYGVTVGEEGLAFKGEAKVGRKAEWPTWTPTPEIKQRLAGIPDFVGPGPHNPMGARALYLFQGNKDTLFRIHGTNQPEYIGQAISSGCIRMLNEDVIDLYTRVPQGANVVVL
ncbi:lipoprotein-anchoring transpeptidase ErfK/SrfK [Ancylobacter aquaticus]|uniref:Lipoprotein-anchoring transpeptidase ErfK/SrfK n=1 Tax=Ancylobacter aquaticus TaxID=100 RepID=A0A4R1IH28_ANCAQ|nr:L,D-transpeptidase [Ancylobacter aquaticus]TCK30712.1 lipoprotein-anchoring transpeptidase ErfK/SrfK [Ancylobacter aquaticus]